MLDFLKKNSERKIIILVLILLSFLFISFRGIIIGKLIEKVNYSGNKSIKGSVTRNFEYNGSGDVGGITYTNYSVKDLNSGIVYDFIMQDLGSDYSGDNKIVTIYYDGSTTPVGEIDYTEKS